MALSSLARVERVSSSGQAEIGARRIYILPTRYGLIFALLVFLMLLGAVNYGNNPAHLLAFLLAAFGSNAIYLTWRNLRALRLRCLGSAPVFAGQAARFAIELHGDERERPAIQLGFDDSAPVLLDLPADGDPCRRELRIDGLARGLHTPGRLVISTQYPVGLFRAWCYVDCERPLLVYPRPGQSWTAPGDDAAAADDGSAGNGNDDFAGLRNYVAGDQPSRIDWKSYARDRGLNTRLFSGQADAPLWIDITDAPGADHETRLSNLCRAVLDADAAGRCYGLRTHDATVAPGAGAAHRHQCLRLLALDGAGNGEGDA
ncbi:MAG: DUF58 domain-containing protein [Gammaproteobacteria bacterium]|nr:DUF58 domain-containing protein [Gammaproteobacteria bacterium]